jgi:hypothetical protein
MPMMKAFLLFLIVGGIGPAPQDMRPEGWNIPAFAQKRFKASSLSKNVEISYAINPFYQSGDFDGDGKLDVALLVKDKVSGKAGIAIIHSGARPAVLLGAGTPWTGDPKYDFNWMDAWQVYPKGPVEQGVGEGKPPILRGDAILAEKTEAASGLIYWTGSSYRWYQQGD